MNGNEKYDQPYAAWHCADFQTIENNVDLSLQCPNCDCELIFVTGIISKFILKPTPEAEQDDLDLAPPLPTQYQEPTPPTFLKWLKKQNGRGDCIGDLAMDFFAAKNFIKKGSYADEIPRDTNNYLAMRQYFYSKQNVVGDSFEMAWREFMLTGNDDA